MRILLLACIITLSSCYVLKFDRQVAGMDAAELKQHFFIFGLVGDKEINLVEECPRGLSSVEERFTFGDVLASIFTVGLYTPKTVFISCAT